MQPIITIRDIPHSDAIESHIRKRADKLNHFYRRINSCRVIVDVPQKHKHQGKLFRVCIDLTVPGKELVVNRKMNQDVYVAIRDAFQALIRQLESYAQKQRGTVKTHEAETHGFITRMFFDEGYGFIQGNDGNEYYFSLTNVCYPHFDQLTAGDSVHFLAEANGEGWHAHRVTKEKFNGD